MRSSWSAGTLGDLCRIRTGRKDVNQGNPDGLFPFFTCAAQHTFSDTYSFDAEALLIAGNGDVGKVSYYNGRFEAYQRTYVLSDFEKVSARFLYLLLDGKLKDSVAKQKLGNTMPYIKIGMLSEFQVPIPPVAEQQRIVAILDEAFASIATAKANAEKNLQNARELYTTRLERAFEGVESTWRSMTLESIGTTQTGSTPKSSEPENLGDFLPFVKPGDFNRDGTISLDNDGLSERGAQKARRVPANSALMVCIGTIGKAGFTESEIATNQQINAWTPFAPMSAKFMYYQMTTTNFQLRVRQNAGQTTLPIINKSRWSALTVLVPSSLAEQLNVVANLDAWLAESMRLEAMYNRKLEALDELKKSLLQQAFSGAL